MAEWSRDDRRTQDVGQELLGERFRQRNAEGRTDQEDDRYCAGELGLAAAAYATHASHQAVPTAGVAALVDKLWPWSWGWWKPKDARRDLVRAGALIIAEIERLDRAAGR